MNKKEFDEWARKMLAWRPKRYSCYRIPSTDIIICVDEKNGNVGVARCHPKDKFVLLYGEAIAIARCAGIEAPTLTTCKKISELKNGDLFKCQHITYRYIGQISKTSHAVIYVDTGMLTDFYSANDREVEVL